MKPAQFEGMSNKPNYEDYIIRMNELDRPPEKKKISKLRSFLGATLKKPLVIDFSNDSKSSFTVFPRYRRPYRDKSGE